MAAEADRLAALLREPPVAKLLGLLPGARLVGGCVRDALAGCPGMDIDLASPDPPETTAATLAQAAIRTVPTGLAHGTVTALLDGHPFEITTLRRDVATDGRHAEVAWTSDWREDAARRDFTINAMSLGADGVLHDYFGGAADLAGQRVRFVGDAAARVAEDYLRILRFFRFHARYGGPVPDPDAIAAIRAGVPGLSRLSAERVWTEWKRILQAPDPARSLALMAETGVLGAIIPEAADPASIARLPPDPILRTAALLTGDSAPFAARLKLSTVEAARLEGLRAGPPPAGDDDALRRLLADTPADILIGRSLLARQQEGVRDRLRAIAPPVFPLQGRDAVAAGIPPGPAVGAALRRVREWWLEGGCKAGVEACRAELARLTNS